MFDYNKKKRHSFFNPIKIKAESILDESRFSYDEETKNPSTENSKSNYVNYSRKLLSVRGAMSSLLSFIGMFLMIIAIRLIFISQGKPTLIVSAVVASALLFSLVGVWYGIIAFFEKEKNHLMAYIGITIGGIQLIILIITIILAGRT